ncbi:MAG: peptidylprolyl isomerase [Proteobacteria bacterium]|nr:MAG: peptidylprolyl isomerase [Pseudomonadota bacterium]
MQIAPNIVASLSYTLKNDQGEILDQANAEHPFVYLHGANNIIPGLEKALSGKQAKDTLTVSIQAADAYGERDERLTQEVPRNMFAGIDDTQLLPGAQFQAQTNAGTEVITVTAVNGDTVTIDANHPLAGETLHFDVTVLDVREATETEMAHGHAHGSNGHHHH